ncbi:unnamed protein product [Candidula unifasciata]|uniref:RING-type E3 ubiquitin transferase n=1 Tax=Candidula unifasciata TaxID=100452 RepID=A0A8S3YMT4_9EUPU|nr:unnamed protein product [Candidula unifasciata]
MAPMEDCTCPICLCILIEPVTMPCKHSICFPCYKQTVEKANLCCPLCRLRISVWARKSAKAGSLIDEAKWAAIKKEFPVQVQKRLEGKETLDDDNDLENYETRLRQLMAVSKPGEIREEYEAELEKLQRRRQEEAKMEEEASAALIRSLQEEMEREREAEARLKEEQDMLDREVAEKLQEPRSQRNLQLSLSLGKKTEPVVSIMRWCVPNNESGNGLQTKNAVVDKLEPRLRYNASVFVDKFEPRHRNDPSVFVEKLEPRHRNDPYVFVEELEPRDRNDPYVFVDELEPRDRNDPNVFVDKLEQRHRNNQGVLNYFGKRKDTTGDDNKKKHVFDDSKRSNDIHNVKRENCVASDSNECSRKKRFKNDSVIGSSASVGQETSAVDVIDLDDVDLTMMSQEELDHLMAVRLQEMYSSLDKKNIAVDRFKGSKDQYMLRKKSARK